MKRALASDFDNTLFFRDTEERFRAQDIFDIMFFQKSGGIFGICTGRSPDSVLETIGTFIRPDFIIAASGALTIDGSGKILKECCMDLETVRQIRQMMAGKAEMVFHAGGKVYSIENPEYPLQIRIRSLEELPQSVYGISMRLPSVEEAAGAAEEIRRRFGSTAQPHVNINHIDVAPAGCSKAVGVRAVREYYNIDCMGGIGDSFNDLPLLEAADVGFTFDTAPAQLKEAADMIVLSVSDAISKLQAMDKDE